MKKVVLIVLMVFLPIFSAGYAYAFVDQGPNNSYAEDAASQCGRNAECMSRVQKRLSEHPRSEHGIFGWIVVIGLVVFAIKFFGSDRKPRDEQSSHESSEDKSISTENQELPLCSAPQQHFGKVVINVQAEDNHDNSEQRTRENMRIAELRAHVDQASNIQIRRRAR